MVENKTLTSKEKWMIVHLHTLIDGVISGEVQGIGVCAVLHDGSPSYGFFNKQGDVTLEESLSQLVGAYYGTYAPDYERINAPENNVSYGSH